MISLRARLFLIIGIVVLIIAGISLFLYSRETPEKNNNANNTNGGPAKVVDSSNIADSLNPALTEQAAEIPKGTPIKPLTSEESIKNSVRQTAKIFFERYNSYSTDNNYDNIREVEYLVTPELWQKISGIMSKPAEAKSFVGATTKVVGSELTAYDSGGARVLLQCKITEEKDNIVSNRQQDAVVELINKDGNWLVNKFSWVK